MWKLTKQYWKDMWNALWSKTSVDEKAVATIKEIKRRYKLTAQEMADVAQAIKEVGNQIDDIDDAIKGKDRKGRKVKKGTK
jgi:replication initiation and membrane attachment protein DnaB